MARTDEPRVAQPTFGRGLLRGLPHELRRAPLVLTQPEPWEQVAEAFPQQDTVVHQVRDLDRPALEARTAAFGEPSAVFGIGGGSAADHAKYVAWRRGWPLVLVPSVLSVDAPFTPSIAVREGQRVRYVGEVFPDHLLVDFDLLQAAPPRLNRAGVGDLLSIFTALWDWREASRRSDEPYDAEIAAEAQRLLDGLLAHPEALRDVSEEGLRLLADGYVREVAICAAHGNARPEEGSEHYIAYCLEAQTGKSYLHGELIAACLILAGHAQGQDVAPVGAYLRAIGLDVRPAALGTSRAELRRALLGLGDYLREETQLLPGVFHFRDDLREEEADELLDVLEGVA